MAKRLYAYTVPKIAATATNPLIAASCLASSSNGERFSPNSNKNAVQKNWQLRSSRKYAPNWMKVPKNTAMMVLRDSCKVPL